MTLFLLIAMTALLVIYLVRVVQLEGNSPNSFVIVPLIIGIALSGTSEYRWFNMEKQGSHIISYISGQSDSELDCQRMIEAFYDFNPNEKGYIDERDPNKVHMKYEECMALTNWLGSDMTAQPASSEQAFALHLLIFEATKVADGKLQEHEVECRATQQYVKIAQYLGATPEEATRMLEMYKTDHFPHLSKEYQLPCP